MTDDALDDAVTATAARRPPMTEEQRRILQAIARRPVSVVLAERKDDR